MKVAGVRNDDVLLIDIGACQVVLLNEVRLECSKAFDRADADKYGPWRPADHSVDRRRELAVTLEQSRTITLGWFEAMRWVTKNTTSLTSESFETRRANVDEELREKLGVPGMGAYAAPVGGSDFWIRDIGDDWVIYQIGGKNYRRSYTADADGTVTFTDDAKCVKQGPVQWIPDEEETQETPVTSVTASTDESY